VYENPVRFLITLERAEKDALEQALHARPDIDSMVHHSDRGVQYLSIR
jgi:hypothetical protein